MVNKLNQVYKIAQKYDESCSGRRHRFGRHNDVTGIRRKRISGG
jgi:hypothetical protein